ncbi:MAG: T9SS type A sorting domain-containing protein, partial [Bacteroidia bacterium]
AYPNPFVHETQIRVSGLGTVQGKLVLLDVQGRRIRELDLLHSESYQLFRENLPPGIYVLQLLESGLPVASLRLIAR